MKTATFKSAIACLLVVSASSAIHADESIIYGGIGPAKINSSSMTSDKTPFSLGYFNVSELNNHIWGLDFSQEGTLLDSTYGQDNAVKQGDSVNLLLGTNLSRSRSNRLDGAVLLGARQETRDCPRSYLGYRCHADSEPNTKYGFNRGAVVTWSYKSVTVGVRATGKSTQALVGMRF